MNTLIPTSPAAVLVLVQDLLGFLNTSIDTAALANVVLDSQVNGVSVHAALVAVDANVTTIVTNPLFAPVAKFLLDRLVAANASN